MFRKSILAIYSLSSCLILVLAAMALTGDGMLPAAFYYIVMGIGAAVGWMGYKVFRSDALKSRRLHIVIASILTLYVMGETTINYLMITKRLPAEIPAVDLGFGAFNGPCATYDNIRGFRWTGDAPRITKIINNFVVYDHFFRLNAQGIYFDRDFTLKKSDSLSRRYIVLGDSFTSGEYLETPWPVRFNEIAGPDIELYSFSVNGGGLYNWHSIFFNEIIPNYEFDGIILPVFGNDLQRDFFVMNHGEESGLTGYLDTIPSNWEELQANYADLLNPYATYLPDSVIEQKKWKARQFADQKFHWIPDVYLLAVVVSIPQRVLQDKKFRQFLNDQMIDRSMIDGPELIDKVLGEKKSTMIEEITSYCKEHNKEMIMATLPYQLALEYLEDNRELEQMAACRAISAEYGLSFFDGMDCFSKLSKSEQADHFLPFDVHWSQAGSDLFAREFHSFLTNEN